MSSANPFRNFDVYKIDPLTEIRNAGIVTNGQVYWVSSGSDSDHRQRTNDMGNTVVKTSLQDAVNAAESNANDYVLVVPTDGGTTRPLSEGFNINKNRVHIIGVGGRPAPNGYGLTFTGFATASPSVVDTELVAVTGAGVEIGGMRFLGTSGTSDTGTITRLMVVGTGSTGTAHDLWVHDTTLETSGASALGAGTAPLVIFTGNVATGIQNPLFERCWMGNFSWAPAGIVDLGLGTAGPTRAQFIDCTFVSDVQATTDTMFIAGTGVTQYTLIKNCDFINVEAGTAPASALTGPVLVDNPVMLLYNTYTNITQAGTDTEHYKAPVNSGTSTAVRDYGITVGTAALSPV